MGTASFHHWRKALSTNERVNPRPDSPPEPEPFALGAAYERESNTVIEPCEAACKGVPFDEVAFFSDMGFSSYKRVSPLEYAMGRLQRRRLGLNGLATRDFAGADDLDFSHHVAQVPQYECEESRRKWNHDVARNVVRVFVCGLSGYPLVEEAGSDDSG